MFPVKQIIYATEDRLAESRTWAWMEGDCSSKFQRDRSQASNAIRNSFKLP